jgi:hypothetical protein
MGKYRAPAGRSLETLQLRIGVRSPIAKVKDLTTSVNSDASSLGREHAIAGSTDHPTDRFVKSLAAVSRSPIVVMKAASDQFDRGLCCRKTDIHAPMAIVEHR